MADYAARAGYALYLCGHTHGGQVCLPGGKPVVTHLARCRRAARGLWQWGGMTGYTTTGLGVSGPPLRFNCPGEAALITLRRST
jgi:predicted MPP superfamily phosphohydrolase